MKTKISFKLSLLIVFTASFAFSAELPYQQRWKDNFHKKVPNLIMDDMELVEMDLFRAVKGIRPMTAALASAIIETCHVDALIGRPNFPIICKRALELKGSRLTTGELKKINVLYKTLLLKYNKRHPVSKGGIRPLEVTFSIRDVRCLEKSISDCKTPEEAVERIKRWHSYSMVIEKVDKVGLDFLKKSFKSGIPVILNHKNNWHVAFGYYGKYIAYNLPAKTPIDKVPRTAESEVKRNRESIEYSDDPQEAYDFYYKRGIRDEIMGLVATSDFETLSEYIILNNGSIVIEPFVEGKYTAYIVHSGRRSAEGLDDEIKKIINYKKSYNTYKFAPTENLSVKLWMNNFFRKDFSIKGNSNLAEGMAIRSGRMLREWYAAIGSVIVSTDGIAPLTNKLDGYIVSAFVRENIRKNISNKEFDACEKLVAHITKTTPKYFEREKKYIFRNHAKFLYQVSKDEKSIKGVLHSLHRKLGWSSVLEGGSNLEYEKYCESIDKGIPVLLKASEVDKWYVCYGYVREEGENYLLLCDTSLLNMPEVMVKRSNLLPETGFWFEKFDKNRYIPYFIHNWQQSAKAWEKEIREVIKKAEVEVEKK